MNLAHLPPGLVPRIHPRRQGRLPRHLPPRTRTCSPSGSRRPVPCADWLDMGTAYMLVVEREGKIVACGGWRVRCN